MNTFKNKRSLLVAILVCILTAPSVAWAGGGDVGTTALFHLINLVALVGVIVYFARGPVQKMLAERKAQVTFELEEAKRLHEEARALLSKYDSQLSQLDTERNAILEEYRALGQSEKTRILDEAGRQAEKITRDAQLQVENEVRRARQALEGEVIKLATDMAEDTMRTRLDANTQANLFDGYLSDMERGLQQ